MFLLPHNLLHAWNQTCDVPDDIRRKNAVRSASDTKFGKGELTIMPDGDCCGDTECC